MSNDLKFWEVVKDVSKFGRSAGSVTDTAINKLIIEVAEQPYQRARVTRPEVLQVARFIANAEPSYINSAGKHITLSMLRSFHEYNQGDLEFIQKKIGDLFKPLISLGESTKVSGTTLVVNTKLTKPKLLKAAISHLLTGSEILKDPKQFKTLLSYSTLNDQHKVSYAFMIGMAIGLKFKSVHELMEAFSLTFVDQAESLVGPHKCLMFYDGSLRTEIL